jgi:hypothetical protein
MKYNDCTVELDLNDLIKIKSLIKSLKEVKKRGGKFVHIEGTLIVYKTGNEIILSTEPQL